MAYYTKNAFIHVIDHAILDKFHSGEWIPEPSTGRIFSRKIMDYLKPDTGSSGYLQINTTYRHRKIKIGVGRAVWVMVHGAPLDASLEIDHINRIKTDNRLVNLRLVTASENQRNARPACSVKIDQETADKIRAEFAAGGVTKANLAGRYKCSRSTISRVLRYETYIPKAGLEEGE